MKGANNTMNYTTIVFKPLIGEQEFVDRFNNDTCSSFKDVENGCKMYTLPRGDKHEMCNDICEIYPGITFIGYSSYDDEEIEIYNQILFNKQDGIFFIGPEYDITCCGIVKHIVWDGDLPVIRGVECEQEEDNEYPYFEKPRFEGGYGTVFYKEKKPKNERAEKDITIITSDFKMHELSDAIIEQYRIDIGIKPEDYNKLCSLGLQHGYAEDGTIFRGSICSPRIIGAVDTKLFDAFRSELILKKIVSDMDMEIIKFFSISDNKEDLESLADMTNVRRIITKHVDYFASSDELWAKLKYKANFDAIVYKDEIEFEDVIH